MKIWKIASYLYAPAATFNDVGGNQENIFIYRRVYIVDRRVYIINRRVYIIDRRVRNVSYHVHNTTVITPGTIILLTICACVTLAFKK